jgi:hypothetical protein
MGFGPPEEDKNIRVAAARPKALPMADRRTIGKLALAAATQLLVAHFQRSASGAETSGRGRDVSPIRGQISPLRPAGGPPVEMTKRNRRLIHD